MNLIPFTAPSTGNFLVDIIKWLIQISSSIAVGVILFTVILKLITLPFDFFSRLSMRKNSVKMEEMRPELEKLQKQYANDKTLYNQKMMALYKKNGYSMWGSCLPSIITLVIFIVAINAFTKYSQYQNREYFYNMSKAYNAVIYEGLEKDDNYIKLSDGTYKIEYGELYDRYVSEGGSITGDDVKTFTSGSVEFTLTNKQELDSGSNPIPNSFNMSIKTANGYIEHVFKYNVNEQGEFVLSTTETFNVIKDKLITTSPIASEVNNYLKVEYNDGLIGYEEYYQAKLPDYITAYNTDIDNDSNIPVDQKDSYKIDLNDLTNTFTAEKQSKIEKKASTDFLREVCQTMSAKTYRDIDKSFLWVKNIWVTDSPSAHPIASSWTKFSNDYKYEDANKNKMNDTFYAELIGKLESEKTVANGYFILAILTAGISFLTQFVMSKSQKSQMELQTVDGQGAKTQKIMMWMMPIMMAFFSFMHTAAFSIYMIISSTFSILTTLGINWIVDLSFAKKNKKAEGDKIHSKVHVEETTDKKGDKTDGSTKTKKEKKPTNKKGKKDPSKKDFINSETEKHIRGRLK